MHSLRQEILPPSGVEFSTTLKLTPSCLSSSPSSSSAISTSNGQSNPASPAPVSPRHAITSRVLCNLIVARSNLLRIFEVREEPAPIDLKAVEERERERERREGGVRRGTEAVEGEVEMDVGGEGFVFVGKPTAQKSTHAPPTITRLYLVKEHRLHGIVTGMEGVRLVSSLEDGLDRLLVSFKDAKIAILEWSDEVHDLITVSIHTYERAPQLLALDTPLFRAQLRLDPLSRCAALSLPKHALAILPFYQAQSDLLEVMDVDVDLDDLDAPPLSANGANGANGHAGANGATKVGSRDARRQPRGDIPYAPSFILDLPAQVDPNLRNVVDFVFLPGFNSPTVAVLYQSELTWTGRLKEYKDTSKLLIFTLDHANQHFPIITAIDSLPYDCLSLLPCPPSIGGVIITTSNALIYVDHQSSSRRAVLPVNGWAARVSDIAGTSVGVGASKEEKERKLTLEGSRSVFVDERTVMVVLRDGTVFPVEIHADGRAVSRLSMPAQPLARTSVPCVVKSLAGGPASGSDSDSEEARKGLVFVGSTVGPSVLVKAGRVEVPLGESEEAGTDVVGAGVSGTEAQSVGASAGAVDLGMDLYDDEDEDLYGVSTKSLPSTSATLPSANAATLAAPGEKKTKTVIQLVMRDALPAYGPITDMAFSLARNGDRPVPELVTTTGSGPTGGFTLFQRDLPVQLKRKIHLIGGARGLWALPVRVREGRGGGVVVEKGLAGTAQGQEVDTMVLSTDGTPSPGLSRIATRVGRHDVSITTRIPGTTIGAGPFFQRTAILHVMTNAIRVLEPGEVPEGIPMTCLSGL
ncbi:hypothetical protein CVT26_000474 [Gymnopilus dilepis]|uniref:Uncharacterized protein n=1 Tax=Gymnopilus dilepis TaxID=231916 RepID=A0A409WW33_9AGAR|nr:hypothetical protein CVT26_000474 [Gymnopilus dilepis]